MTDTPAGPLILERLGLDSLVATLIASGYGVIAPTVRDGAIVYAEISSASELPQGWGDDQDAGRYRLRRRGDEALFGYALGPTSWKQFLFPPMAVTWRAERDGDGVRITEPRDAPRYAFLGVRACELAAIEVQDRVFVHTPYPDRDYVARRDQVLLIAVNCSDPAATCFCTSMGTGPRAEAGYDLALTELLDDEGHRFLLEIGSTRGAAIASALPARPAGSADESRAAAVTAGARSRMGRSLDTDDVQGLLGRNLEHPRWDEVAGRCLACGNCTMVCPTCFCADVQEVSSLDAGRSEQQRLWASCFSVDHSQLHGGAVRRSGRSRYRQWLTHKLGTWHDQFGTSGCVGCGRCIAWCPVGIDITEETAAIRATDGLIPIPIRAEQ